MCNKPDPPTGEALTRPGCLGSSARLVKKTSSKLTVLARHDVSSSQLASSTCKVIFSGDFIIWFLILSHYLMWRLNYK
jgi:hypothetical protein